MIHSSVKIGQYCIIDPEVEIGEGTVIKSYVEIRKGTKIGKFCYIDSGVKISGQCSIGDKVVLRYNSIIARGCEIGDNNYFAPNCMTNNLDSGIIAIGGAKTGKDCFFGTGTVLQHGIKISDKVTTGTYTFVNKSIDSGTYVGTPAKKIK